MTNQWNPDQPPAGPPSGPPTSSPGGPLPAPGAAPPPGAPQPPGAGQPYVAVEPAGGGGRSRATTIAAVLAVVALVGAGVFAATRIVGGDDEPSGASSAEELGEMTLQAFDEVDAIAAAELLLPGERRAISDPAFDMIDELERLEVLSDVNLESVNGVEVTLENKNVDVVETNVEDLVMLDLSAEATVEVNADELPTGPVIDERLDESSQPQDQTTNEPFEVEIVGVRQGDEWFLSIGYTVAEVFRNGLISEGDIETEAEIPSPEEGVAPNGADTPDGAVDAMFEAVADKDLEAIIAGLDPGEMGALQRYAPLFLDDAQEDLDESDFTISVTESDLRAEGSGDQREVFIEDVAFEFESEGDTGYVQYSDGCITVESNSETDEVCLTGDGIEAELDNALNDLENPEPVREFIDAAKEAFADFEVPGIVVTDVDGEWYVSLIGTYDNAVLNVLEALDAEELRDLVEKGEEALESTTEGEFDDIDLGD